MQAAIDAILGTESEFAGRLGRHDWLILFNAWTSPESLAAVAAASIFAKAFLETLGKRAGDGIADLVQTRFRRNGNKTEAEIGLDDDASAKIAITEDTPDEARLALLDLDVTAGELRGKVLRWDHETSAWRPDDD